MKSYIKDIDTYKELSDESIVIIIRSISYFSGLILFCKNNLDEDSLKALPDVTAITDFVNEKYIADSDFTSGLTKQSKRLDETIREFDDTKISVFKEIISKIGNILYFCSRKEFFDNDFNKGIVEIFKYREFNKITGSLLNCPVDQLKKLKEAK